MIPRLAATNRALGVTIGQTMLVSNLVNNVPRLLPSVSPHAVINAEALNMGLLTDNPQVLRTLRSAWAYAVREVLILALAAVVVSVPFSCWIEPFNIKAITRQRAEQDSLARRAVAGDAEGKERLETIAAGV